MREKPRGHCILAKGKRGMRELALVCPRLLSYIIMVATLQMPNVSLFLVYRVVQQRYIYDLNAAPYRSRLCNSIISCLQGDSSMNSK